ncbi:MAG: cell division protein FtsA [Synergistaceae bacterium]|nr:cell division protein FtsA [Synergistaceae bacterium]
MESDTLVGLSIGTTTISVIVADRDPHYQPDSIHVIGMGCSPSRGLSKGVITKISDATESISRAFREAENVADRRIDSAVVAFNALDVKSVTREGRVSVGGRELKQIATSDLDRAIGDAKNKLEASTTTIPVHTIPVRYELDGRVVEEPLNMTGSSLLELMLQTVQVPTRYVNDVITCVHGAGVEVEGLVLKPLAASLGSVTEEEMRAGCISISIGGGSTGIVLYQGGRPFRIVSIPIGGYHITSDLASVLHLSLRDAESIKRRVFTDDEETLRKEGIDIGMSIQVIGARVEELFMDYVKVALAECDPQSYPGGVILSGGVSNTPGIVEMLEDILGMQVRVAQPFYTLPPGRDDPSFVSVAGVLRYIRYQERDAYLFIPPSHLPGMGAPYASQETEESRSIHSLERSGENLRGFMKTLMDRFGDLF